MKVARFYIDKEFLKERFPELKKYEDEDLAFVNSYINENYDYITFEVLIANESFDEIDTYIRTRL